MKRTELMALWNRLLSSEDTPMKIHAKGFPRYCVELKEGYTVDRRYADGGSRCAVEAVLRGAAVCVCEREEDDLVEELHRRCDLLAAALPMTCGECELLHFEMVKRPTVVSRTGSAAVGETVIRLTLRRGGKKHGIVPFFGQGTLADARIYEAEGIFLPVWEDGGGEVLSRYMDEASVRGNRVSGQEVLRVSFDRIPGAAAQDMLLALTDRNGRGRSAVVQVYFADYDRDFFGKHVCMRCPMAVRIDKMVSEEVGTVFGCELIACGKRQGGFLTEDGFGGFTFEAGA